MNDPKNSQRGAALLLVILLVSLLTIAVLEFQREAFLELRAAASFRDSAKAHALLRSGLTAAETVLIADILLDKENNRQADSTDEIWAMMLPLPPMEDGSVALAPIEDLDGKFPINALIDPTQTSAPAVRRDMFKRLIAAFNMDGVDEEALITALEDWIDAGGAGPFYIENLDSLRSIEGFDKILEKEDGTQQTVADILIPHLDVRILQQRDYKINVNTASAQVLKSLHQDLTDADVEDLMSKLPETKLPNITGASPLSDPRFGKGWWDQHLRVNSDRFYAEIDAEVNGVARKAKAILKRNFNDEKIEVESWFEE